MRAKNNNANTSLGKSIPSNHLLSSQGSSSSSSKSQKQSVRSDSKKIGQKINNGGVSNGRMSSSIKKGAVINLDLPASTSIAAPKMSTNLVSPPKFHTQAPGQNQVLSSSYRSDESSLLSDAYNHNQNKENLPIQAHYIQYLQLQIPGQSNNLFSQSQQFNSNQYYQLQQKNSLNSNNFHSSDMSLSQSSNGGNPSEDDCISRANSGSQGARPLSNQNSNAKIFKPANSVNFQATNNAAPSFFQNLGAYRQKQKQHLENSEHLQNKATGGVRNNDVMLIPQDSQNLSPSQSSSYDGLQSLSNTQNTQNGHQQPLLLQSLNQPYDLASALDSQQQHYIGTEGGTTLSMVASSSMRSLVIGENDQNNSIIINGSSHQQMVNMQDRDLLNNSAHRQLVFDSQTSSQSNLLQSNQENNNNNNNNNNREREQLLYQEQLNRYCDLLQLASPELSSTGHSIIYEKNSKVEESNMIDSQRQEAQQLPSQNFQENADNMRAGFSKHFEDFIMAHQQQQMFSQRISEQVSAEKHSVMSQSDLQNIQESAQTNNVQVALNNSLLECVDQFGDHFNYDNNYSDIQSPSNADKAKDCFVNNEQYDEEESKIHDENQKREEQHSLIPSQQYISQINHSYSNNVSAVLDVFNPTQSNRDFQQHPEGLLPKSQSKHAPVASLTSYDPDRLYTSSANGSCPIEAPSSSESSSDCCVDGYYGMMNSLKQSDMVTVSSGNHINKNYRHLPPPPLEIESLKSSLQSRNQSSQQSRSSNTHKSRKNHYQPASNVKNEKSQKETKECDKKPNRREPFMKTIVKQQMVEILDDGGDTPSMAISSKESIEYHQNKCDADISPEILGSRESRRKLDQNCDSSRNGLSGSQHSARHLNFQDTSPLVKSCNLFPIQKQQQQKQRTYFDHSLKDKTLGYNPDEEPEESGTAALYGLLQSRLSEQNTQKLQQQQMFRTQQRIGSNDLERLNEQDVLTKESQVSNKTKDDNLIQDNPLKGSIMTISSKQKSQYHQIELLSPANCLQKDSKLSSLIESPMPPVTDPKNVAPSQMQKGVKDFSRQYLKEGMWPGKINHSVLEYRQSIESGMVVRGAIPHGSFTERNTNAYNTLMQQHDIKGTQGNNAANTSVQVLSTAGSRINPENLNKTKGGTTTAMEIRIKPYIENVSKSGSITERGASYSVHQPANYRKQHQLSISKTIEIVPSSTSYNPLYPNVDPSIVNKINSTLDNTYYQSQQMQQQRDASLHINNNSGHTLLPSHRQNNPSIASNISSSRSGGFQMLKKASEQQFGLGSSSITSLRQSMNNTTHQQMSNRQAGRNQGNSISNQNRAEQQMRSQSNNTMMNFNSLSGQNQSTCPDDLQSHNWQQMQTQFMSTGLANLTTMPTQNNFFTTNKESEQFLSSGTKEGNATHQKQLLLGCSPLGNACQHQEQCKECHFEKEKRMVTQKAFERAIGISMFLMQEIEKLSLNNHLDHASQKVVTRQEILNLLNIGGGVQGQTLMNNNHHLNNTTTMGLDNNNARQHLQTADARLFSRSKSQNLNQQEMSMLMKQQRTFQAQRGSLATDQMNGFIKQ